ncbi:MAG TPA: ferredoxin [Actinomycetes bacterium]|jgi:ferredoxin|nr:ferredoxin [Actinomycetes bacterium]
MGVRIRVDHDKCFGYGRCIEIAPHTFSLNEDGQSVAGEPQDDEDAIRDAAWACPMQAIELSEA